MSKIENHIEQARDRLITQFRGKKNIDAIVQALGKQTQDLEDALFPFYDARLNINTAVGEQLDRLGQIVGQERLGYDDTFYRVLISARIGINTSQGTVPDLIDIASIATSVLQEIVEIPRVRVENITRDTQNGFNFDGIALLIQQGDFSKFFEDFTEGTVNGFTVTNSEPIQIAGSTWQRIEMANYPTFTDDFIFIVDKPHPQGNIQFFNLGNGEVAFGTSGYFPENLRGFLVAQLENTVIAGVRLDYICFYEPDDAFAFAGGQGDGFGVGKFGSLSVDDTPFRLAGEGTGGGLGSVYDPLTGGIF